MNSGFSSQQVGRVLGITSLFLGLLLASGCHKTSQADAVPEAPVSSVQPVSPGHQAIPFGVFDIQSGHGHGKWRQSTEPLAR